MIADFAASPPPAAADVIVVGAGAVGLATAVDLARRGKRVTVLEAGGRSVEPASQAFFRTASWTGYPLEGLHLGRFRVLGGTTTFWSGQLVRFDPIVFEPRPWLPCGAWPITRAELDPSYDAALDLLGLGRRIDDDQAVWRRLRLGPPPSDADVEVFLSRWVPETNFARLFATGIATDPMLTILTGAPVTAIDLDAEKRIQGVVVTLPDLSRRQVAAPRVILALGTIEIARLLSLPLADGNAAPWAGNPWLGRGFIDHVDCHAGRVHPLDRRRFHARFDSAFADGLKYTPRLKLSEAAQRRDRLLGIGAHFLFSTRLADDLAAMKIFARGLLRGRLDAGGLRPDRIGPLMRLAAPMVARYLRHRRSYNPADGGIQLRLTTEQAPLRTSALRLQSERDALGVPVVAMTWDIDGRELETMAAFAERVAAYLERHGLARVDLDPRLPARDPGFLATIDDANHQMGMARMAPAPSGGVVDRDLQVFGSRGLFVAGAATYPSSGFANPTLTAIALGLRLARAIGEERV